MPNARVLIVVADDYGIGPETSRGILRVATAGAIDASVLLVNSPDAAAAVRAWRRAGCPFEMGWHPCLTLDAPILPPDRVPSLVADGKFRALPQFLQRIVTGRICFDDVRREFAAQIDRYIELVGQPPSLVASHQHVSVFPPVGDALRAELAARRLAPFVRRVYEPCSLLWRVAGGRLKRLFLTTLGRREMKKQRLAGLPGADVLLGITDPRCVRNPAFFTELLAAAEEQVVELMVHPGFFDATLVGRDAASVDDVLLRRRVDELERLFDPRFQEAVRRAGFRRLTPAQWLADRSGGLRHVG